MCTHTFPFSLSVNGLGCIWPRGEAPPCGFSAVRLCVPVSITGGRANGHNNSEHGSCIQVFRGFPGYRKSMPEHTAGSGFPKRHFLADTSGRSLSGKRRCDETEDGRALWGDKVQPRECDRLNHKLCLAVTWLFPLLALRCTLLTHSSCLKSILWSQCQLLTLFSVHIIHL